MNLLQGPLKLSKTPVSPLFRGFPQESHNQVVKGSVPGGNRHWLLIERLRKIAGIIAPIKWELPERWLSCDHFIEDAAKSIHVRTQVKGQYFRSGVHDSHLFQQVSPLEQLLRGHVEEGAAEPLLAHNRKPAVSLVGRPAQAQKSHL